MRDSVLLTRAMLAALCSLRSLKDVQSIVAATVAVGLDGQTAQVPEHLLPVWALIEPVLKANRDRYERTCEERRKAGIASANKRQQTATNVDKRQQMLTSVNDNDNECLLNETLKKESTLAGTQEKIKKTQFKKPALEEIKAYAVEQNIALDANAFFDYYEAKGWKVGNAPMKDWQAAVRNWARNDKQFNRQNQTGYAKPGTESSYGRYIGKH